MYGDFWHFSEPPFRNEFRREFYYASPTHQAALLKLRYAVEQRTQAALLLGPPGTGKSFLIQMLANSLPENAGPLFGTSCPSDSADYLLLHIAETIGSQVAESISGHIAGADPYAAWRGLQRELHAYRENGQHPVLVLEEAQLLQNPNTWEVMRNLMTLTLDGATPWTVVVVAQPLLLARLERLPHVEEIFFLKTFLRPLTATETAEYISHCLHTVGCSEDIFAPEAVESVAEFSAGIPRRINRLCDLALLLACAEKSRHVTREHIEAVVEELALIPAQ